MGKKILIIGASGSGTSTVGSQLAGRLKVSHIESDNLFWIPTYPPYTTFRDQDQLDMLIRTEVMTRDGWVLSGSPCGWGDAIIKMLDLVVFLVVPAEVRISRIARREQERFGSEIMQGGPLYESHQDFLAWTRRYDEGGISGRTKIMHENWLLGLNCPVLRFEGEIDSGEIVAGILTYLRKVS